jgi:hypothetical protein
MKPGIQRVQTPWNRGFMALEGSASRTNNPTGIMFHSCVRMSAARWSWVPLPPLDGVRAPNRRMSSPRPPKSRRPQFALPARQHQRGGLLNHHDVTSLWPGPPQCGIVVVSPRHLPGSMVPVGMAMPVRAVVPGQIAARSAEKSRGPSQPGRCHIIPVLCGSMSHRPGCRTSLMGRNVPCDRSHPCCEWRGLRVRAVRG